MKNIPIVFLIAVFALTSCKQKKSQNNNSLVVEGKIKGLRLGSLLLKKMENDSVVSIDSVKIDGNEHFQIKTSIDQPQELMLEMPEIKDGRILFFAAPGDTVKIYTFLESFGVNPVIIGGENQEKLNEYNDMMRKFNDKELDLFKARFEAAQSHNQKLMDSLEKASERLQKKKQLYKLNFIFTHKNLPVAGYLGYTEFYNNKKALDTIYKILNDTVKRQLYGEKIKELIQ